MSKWNQSRKQIIEEITRIKFELMTSHDKSMNDGEEQSANILLGKAFICSQIVCMLSEMKVSKVCVITNKANEDVSDDKQLNVNASKNVMWQHEY